MPRIIGLFLFALSLVTFNNVTANAQAKNAKDIFGYFSFAKTAPTAFRDIDTIHLAGDYGAKEKPPFYGLIRHTARRAIDHKILKPSGTGKNISFTTNVVRGVSYKFAGAFTTLDVESLGMDSEKVALKGTLTKLRNGKQIAQSEVGFTYFPGT